jgi:hypothetical protein
VVVPAALAVATFLAATPWVHVFSVPGTAALLVVAAVLSVAIPTAVIRFWQQRPAVSYVASGVGLLVVLCAAAGLHPASLWHGLTSGPNRVLTETLPLSGTRALLSAPLLLTWMCGTATTELVTRARRSNSGLAAVGLAIPVACFVLAYAISASRPGQGKIAGPLLLLTLMSVAVLRHLVGIATAPQAITGTSIEAAGRPSLWRAGVAGVAVVAITALVLTLIVPSLSRMSRRPVSLNRAPPLATAVVSDPLDAMAGLRDGAPHNSAKTLLHVRTSQPSSGYLATVILDGYDGGLWSFHSVFQPTGGRVPAPSGAAGGGTGVVGLTTVRQDTALVSALPVPFLPALDRPVAVRGLEVRADAGTGMLLPGHATRGTVSYSVVSQAPTATLATVPSADGIGSVQGQALPGAGLVTQEDVALPPDTAAAIGTALRFLATVTGRRPAASVAFLQAAMSSLRADERRIDPALPPVASSAPVPKPAPAPASSGKKGASQRAVSRPAPSRRTPRTVPTRRPAPRPVQPAARGTRSGGTSLSVVINAVVNTRAATPEQFATFYALVARYLGVPARLVTGFRLTAGPGSGPLPAGNHLVTNRQAWTWVEVPVAGVGWVVADPTPAAVTAASAPTPLPVQGTPTTVQPPQANAVPRNEIVGGHALSRPSTVHGPDSSGLPWWGVLLTVVGGVVLLLALLGPGLAAARRAFRRRARRRADPSELAVGAWLELLDALEQAGMSARPGDTSAEVAEEAGRHFGPEVADPVQEVGLVAEQAVFSVSVPPDEDVARRAWDTQRTLRLMLHRNLDRRQRARSLLVVGTAPRDPSSAPGSATTKFGA